MLRPHRTKGNYNKTSKQQSKVSERITEMRANTKIGKVNLLQTIYIRMCFTSSFQCGRDKYRVMFSRKQF